MSRPRAFVTRHVYPQALQILREVADVDYRDARDGPGQDELVERVAEADALVCQLTDRIDERVLAAGRRLRVVANIAVGYDNVDVKAATARGILVTNTPGVLTESTADLTFALLLATARRLVEGDRLLRAGRFRQWEIDLLCGPDVHGKVLGIVGFGRIGRAVAARARGFAMDVLYCRRHGRDPEAERDPGVRYRPLPALLSEADFVSLHVPLCDSTRHLIGTAELERMKPGAILINTARGPIVDEAALAEGLQRGRPAGAGLDVFEHEPEVHPGLLAQERAVLLPHIGSASIETRTRMCTLAAENAAAVLRGGAPPHPVNPEVLEKK